VARLQKRKQAAVTTGLAEHVRPSLRDGFGGLYALFPGTGLIAPVARALVKQQHGLGASTGAPEPRDFAVASELFVGMKSCCNPTRPPHPAPDVRDDREAPPRWDGMRPSDHDFRKSESNYFCAKGWTGRLALKALAKLAVGRGPLIS
jgi:hypothetical protein